MAVTFVVATVETLAAAFARVAVDRARSAVAARGRFVLAIPGGSAAEHLLPALANAPIPWRETDVFWVDERAVPATSAASNFGLANRLLFGRGAARQARLNPFVAGSGGTDFSTVDAELGRVEPIDLALLGFGEDGHIASLFPGHPELEVRNRRIVAVSGAPKPPPDRVSLTLPVLRAARLVCIAGFGVAKALVVRSALSDRGEASPLSQLIRSTGEVHCYLDIAAGSQVPRGTVVVSAEDLLSSGSGGDRGDQR